MYVGEDVLLFVIEGVDMSFVGLVNFVEFILEMCCF